MVRTMNLRYELILTNSLFRESLCKINKYEKDRIFCNHSIEHFINVARIGYIITLEKGLEIPKDIIYAAALLHDIGRFREYEDGTPHDTASADIAETILSECGYSAEQIASITQAIAQHRKSISTDNPETLAAVLYSADKLSRACHCCNSYTSCNWEKSQKNDTLKY